MINTSAQLFLKNSIFNFISFTIPIIVVIFFTPIIIFRLGAHDYGIFILLTTIITFLGLLDLGVGTANSKHIIEYYTLKKEKKLRDLLHSMNTVYLIMALILLVTCICLGIGFWLVGNSIYLILLTIIGLNIFITTIFNNFSNIFVTMQRYDVYTLVSMITFISFNVGMLLLVVFGYGLTEIFILQLVLAIVNCIIFFILAKKLFPFLSLKYDFKKGEIWKNYKFGLSVAFNNLATSSLVHFDKILIPIFLGNAQLTFYSVPGSITNRISQISGTFSSLLFPVTVNLISLDNLEKIKRVYIRSLRLVAILSSAISLSIIFLSDKILFYWLDDEFLRNSLIVLVLLVLTNFLLALYNPLLNLMMAMGKMKFLTKGSIIMATVNIVALVILMPIFGINGAAMAYFLGVIPIIVMILYAEKKIFKINLVNFHFKLILKISITGIALFAFEFFIIRNLVNSFINLLILGPLSVILFLVLYKIMGFFEIEDWNDFKLIIFKVFVKLCFKKL